MREGQFERATQTLIVSTMSRVRVVKRVSDSRISRHDA